MGLGLQPHLVPSLHELHPGVDALDGVYCVLLRHIFPVLALGHPVSLVTSCCPVPAVANPAAREEQEKEKRNGERVSWEEGNKNSFVSENQRSYSYSPTAKFPGSLNYVVLVCFVRVPCHH